MASLLFGQENVSAYYLEFDDARSGGFAPLKELTGDKKVVLGLITSKHPKLEDKAAIIAHIHEAASYVPLNRLALSPQCGFASCECGNKLDGRRTVEKTGSSQGNRRASLGIILFIHISCPHHAT